MDVTEVNFAEKAFIGISNVLVRLHLRRTNDDEEGRQLRVEINRLNNAQIALSNLYGHISSIIPDEVSKKR